MSIATKRENIAGNSIEKMKSIKVGDFIVPILFVFIFGILVVYVYIPRVTEAFEMRSQMEEIRSKQRQLQKNLDVLQPLISDRVQLQRDLNVTKSIIPKKLDVGDFSYYVDKLAQGNGLLFKEISQQSTSTKREEDITTASQVGSNVSNVSGPIVYEGTYAQIVDFLDKLQRESPYIVEASKLDLNKARSFDSNGRPLPEAEWRLELDITGFFIERDTDVSIGSIYLDIIPYTTYKDILQTFYVKSEILEKNNPSSE